jgi:hypothetical protein
MPSTSRHVTSLLCCQTNASVVVSLGACQHNADTRTSDSSSKLCHHPTQHQPSAAHDTTPCNFTLCYHAAPSPSDPLNARNIPPPVPLFNRNTLQTAWHNTDIIHKTYFPLTSGSALRSASSSLSRRGAGSPGSAPSRLPHSSSEPRPAASHAGTSEASAAAATACEWESSWKAAEC